IGGRILVADPGPDPGEVVSGADLTFNLNDPALPSAPEAWRPRTAGRLIDDDGGQPPVIVHRLDQGILVDAVGEPPLLIGGVGNPGRWSGSAVAVLFAPVSPPPVRLIALALDDVDGAIAQMAPQLA